MMKKTLKVIGLIAVLAVITFAGCKDPGADETTKVTPPPSTDIKLKDLKGELKINSSDSEVIYTGMELSAAYDKDESEDFAVIYQWNKDGEPIPGANNATYIPYEGGDYSVTVSAGGYNPKTSDAVTVTLFTPSAGLYASAPPILPTNISTLVSSVTANDVAAAVTYIKTNPGTYTLIIDQDIDCAPQTLNVTDVKLTIIGIGDERQIKLSSNGNLFTVGAAGQTGIELTIGNNVTLVGRSADGNGNENNNSNLVYINDSCSFTMLEGSKVTGNTAGINVSAAVFLYGHNTSFTMNGGTITGNKSLETANIYRCGGLLINYNDATVKLNGGSIIGNEGPTADVSGRDSFTLSGNTTIGEFCIDAIAIPGGTGYTSNCVIKIADNWTGSVDRLNMRGASTVLADIPEQWSNIKIIEGADGYSLKTTDLAKFNNAYFYTAAGLSNQPISDTHKIENSGENIGKLIRTAFSSAPVLTLTPGDAKLTYTWTASAPVADSYDVYWKAGSSLSATEVKTGTKITGATTGGVISGLTNGTAYSVVVVANKAGLLSIDSEVKTATPVATPFTSAPTLTLAVGNTELTYTWTASNPVADTYDVYWKAGSSLTAANVKTGTKITGATSGGKITGLTNGTAYSVIVTANKAGYAAGDSAVQTATPVFSPYIVTGSGTTFTATKDGATVGTANQPIQTVITGIRTHANRNQATIQFGNGGADDILDIGTANIQFNNTGGNWGDITLTGGIMSSSSSDPAITINISSVTSSATILSISNDAILIAGNGPVTISDGTVAVIGQGSAISINNTATVTISGGTVSGGMNGGTAVYNRGNVTVTGTADITSNNDSTSSGTIIGSGYITISGGMVRNSSTNSGSNVIYRSARLTITGGRVSTTAGNAVNNDVGFVTISGGEVKTDTGRAIYNPGTAKVTISGGTVSATSGTAVVNYFDQSELTIDGGTVSATTGTAVSNSNAGTVTISGGTVSATSGSAVSNVSRGTVTISGGTVSATTGIAVYNRSVGKITISGATTKVTSANVAASTPRGTIYLGLNPGDANTVFLEIQSGTVENTGTNGYAIYNNTNETPRVIINSAATIKGQKYGCP